MDRRGPRRQRPFAAHVELANAEEKQHKTKEQRSDRCQAKRPIAPARFHQHERQHETHCARQQQQREERSREQPGHWLRPVVPVHFVHQPMNRGGEQKTGDRNDDQA